MRFNKTFLAVIFLLTASVFLHAQVEDDVINVDSSIVRLNVGVVNRSGQPIVDLNRSNFTLYENGVKQEILRFEPTVSPFSVVMILDMSGSTLGFRQTIQTSAFRFIDALSPNDRVSIIEFYDKINVLNEFTTNRKTLANSITVANGRGKTQLYKALETALAKLSREENRRKAIIVLTDGVDTAVREQDRELLAKLDEGQIPNFIDPEKNQTLASVLNKAAALGVTVYPLALPTGDPSKLADPTPIQTEMYEAARERLKMLAERTGGTLNSIERLEQMGRLYAQVAADVRSLYTIEYQPSNTQRDGKWREIKIEVDKPELISRTRPGYFAN